MFRVKQLRLSAAIVALSLVFAAAMAAQPALADTLTWSGSSGATWDVTTNNWSTWSGTSGGPWDTSHGSANIADFNTLTASAVINGSPAAVNVNGLQFDNTATVSGGTINLLTGTLPTPTITANAAASITSVLAGSSGLRVTGPGVLTLGGVNNFTGGLTINNGVVSISSSNNLPASNALTFGGGTLNVTANVTLAENVTIASGQVGTLKPVGAATATLAGSYTNTAGTLTLDARGVTNSYGGFGVGSTAGLALGSTVLIYGTTNSNNVQVGASNGAVSNFTFFANSKLSIIASGAGNTYLAFGNGLGGAHTAQFGALDGGNATTIVGFDNRTGSTLQINGVANGNFTGTVINGLGGSSGINLYMTGTANQTLSGFNSYTGNTTISGGALIAGTNAAVSANGAFGNSAAAIVMGDANTTTNNSSPSLLIGGPYTIGRAVTVASQSTTGAYTIGGNTDNTATFSGLITISQPLTIAQAANTGINALNVTGGITSGLAGSQTVTFAGPGVVNVGTGAIADGAGSLAVAVNGGVVNFSAANAYTGATSVSGGTLSVSGASAINSSSGISINGSTAAFNQTSFVASTPAVTLTQGVLAGTGTMGNVTVGNATGGTIANGGSPLTLGNLSFGGVATMSLNVSSSSTAGVVVSNNLTTGSGSNEIKLNASNASWTNGTTYELVSYGALLGTGFTDFTKGTITNLGARQSAVLTNSSGFIGLSITGDLPIWTGAASGNWTTNAVGAPYNWKLQLAGTGTEFLTNDSVLFNDSVGTAAGGGPGATTILINQGNVSPSSVQFSNSLYAYTISGSNGIAAGALTKNGGGALTISTSNSYNGGTVLNAGLLNVNNNSALGTGPFTLAGGTIDSTVAGITLPNNAMNFNGSFAFGGSNPLNLGAGAVAMSASPTITVNSKTLTVGGGINGAGALTKNGSGTLVLGGNSGFLGGTTVLSGLLVLNNNSAAGTGPLTISGGSIDSTSGGATLANNAQNWNTDFVFLGSQSVNMGTGPVTLSANRIVTVNANTLTVGGAISDGFAGYSLTKAGSGTLALTGASTYGGPTNINAGTLLITTGATLPAASPVTIVTGAALGITGNGTMANNIIVAAGQVGTLKAVGSALPSLTGDYSGTAGTLTLDETGVTSNYGGFNIQSASGPPLGSVVLVLGTTSANNVQIGDVNSAYQAFFASSKVSIVATGTGFTYFACGNNTGTNMQFGALDGGNATTKIGFDNRTGQVTINGTDNGNYSGYIYNGDGGTGPLALVMSGTATQILSGSNTYTGSTTIQGGVLQLGSGGTAGSISPASIITNNGTLAFNHSDNIAQGIQFTNQAVTGVGGLTQMGPGTLTLNQMNSYSGSTIINGGVLNAASLANEGTPSAIGQGSGSVSPADLVINGGTLQYTGGAAASTNFLFTIGASGNAALDASGNFFGPLTVGSAGGSLAFANTAAPATLTLTGSGAGTLGAEVDNSGTSLNVTSLVKAGGGTWVLTGPNTYTGPTTVSAGALFINGSNAAGGISVAAGATLGGSGTAAGLATVASGGSIQAGYNGAGSLTLGGLSIGTGTVGITTITNYAGSAAIVVTGSNGLTVSGGSNSVTIALSGPIPTGSGSVELLQYAGAIQGGNSNAFTLNTAGLQNLSARAILSLTNPNGFIDLNYKIDYPIWSGLGNGIWDTVTQSPKNWALASNGSPTDFIAGDAVVFDDNAGTNTAVSISGTGDVRPTSITFNNLNQNYLIQGTHAIAGSATLAVNGGGFVAIANTNSYTGGTALTNGTLSFASGALGSAGNITIAGSNADLQWYGSNTQDVSGRLVIIAGATAAIDTQSNNVTFASGFGGGQSGSLIYVGSGTLTMTAPNTYIGSTTISSGTLQLGDGTPGHDGSLASLTINDNAALVYKLASSQTYSGAIGGTGSLQKSGSGTLTLAGNNNYNGATTVNGGVLSVASTSNLPSNGPLALANGAALNMTAGMMLANAVTVASGQSGTLRLAGTGAVTVTGDFSGTAGTLTLDERSAISNYGGFSIQSTSMLPLGSVVQVLGATGSNNVQIGDNSFAYQSFFGNSKLTFVASGTGNTYLAAGNNSVTILQVGALDGGNPTTLIGFDNRSGLTLMINGVANGNFAGTIFNGFAAGANSLVMTGTATQVLSGKNTYTGATTINGGVLNAGSPEDPGISGPLGIGGTINFGGGTLQYSASNQYDYSPRLSTAGFQNYSVDTNGQNVDWAANLNNSGGTLTKLGGGSLTLTGTNSYDGGTVVIGGTLIAANSQAIEDGTNLYVGDPTALMSLGYPAPVVPSTAPAALVAPVPEPGTFVLLAAIVGSALVYRRIRKE